MALVKCPECSRQVSDQATACPQCAYPIAGGATAGRVQTIEATGKKWKGLQLISGIVLIISIIGIFSSSGTGSDSSDSSIWGLLLLASIIIWLYARFSAWWHHR